MIKRSGTSTDPCGTLEVMINISDVVPSMSIVCGLTSDLQTIVVLYELIPYWSLNIEG